MQMANDRRVKGCPNTGCYQNQSRRHYKARDQYCITCGTKLVYVCANCFGPISTDDPNHRICEHCKAGKNQLLNNAKDGAVKVVAAGSTFVAASAKYINDNADSIKKAAKEATPYLAKAKEVIKKK